MNIRQTLPIAETRPKMSNGLWALIDRLGPVGKKKHPGPLYGVKTHAWSALGVAVTAAVEVSVGATR